MIEVVIEVMIEVVIEVVIVVRIEVMLEVIITRNSPVLLGHSKAHFNYPSETLTRGEEFFKVVVKAL